MTEIALSPRPRVLFVLEQVLGHVSLSQNVKRFGRDPEVDAHFTDITFHRDEGVVERLPIPSYLRGALRARLEVREALSNGPPDAFFFNTQKPAVLCPDYVQGRPTVVSLDVTPVQYDGMAEQYEHRPDTFAPIRTVKHAVNRRLFQRASKLLPWSSWVARSLVDDYGVPQSRVRVIPPGADLDRWTPGTSRDAGPVRIVFVGGNFQRKGGPLLLDWYSRTAVARQCELHLVTRDPVGTAPGVHVYHDMTNNSDELIALVRSADIFALPTLADCFSIASIEAAAAGLPVVTSDVGGISDIVKAGETGFLCAPGDGAGLAGALNALVADASLRRRMGEAARAHMEQGFDAAANVREIIGEIKSALASRAE